MKIAAAKTNISLIPNIKTISGYKFVFKCMSIFSAINIYYACYKITETPVHLVSTIFTN